MLLSHTSQLSAPSRANGCSHCLPFLFCLLSSIIKKSCSLTVIVVPASAVVDNRPARCFGISRHWGTLSLWPFRCPLAKFQPFLKRELLPVSQEIPRRAGLRAMAPRASTRGMEGKPSESDFTYHICSHTELWRVGVMLCEDFQQFWVVPTCVFHLHPPWPAGTAQTSAAASGDAGDAGVPPGADSVWKLPLREEGSSWILFLWSPSAPRCSTTPLAARGC